ncbi:MAG: EAL domain-containing protein [Lachnospiraceae bacterium]|nr:EAL domain-containing protein [Lachnospiraceae bacterium]
MISRIYFDIAALPIFLIIICTAISRGMTKGRSNRLFLVVLASAFMADLAEVLEQFAYAGGFPIGAGQIAWVKVCEYIYFTCRNFTNTWYLLFVFSMTKTWFRVRPLWKRFLTLVPNLVILFSLIFNEKTHYIFTVSAEAGYERGSHILIVYYMATFYMIFGSLYLCFNKKTLTNGVWIALMSMYVLNVTAVLIQFFYPELYIESFAASLTMFFVVLFVQTPETQADPETGIPGYRAFCSEISKIGVVGHPVSVVTIVLKNARQMQHYIGEGLFNSYVRLIADEIRAYTKREHLYCDLYYEYPGIYHAILEDTRFNPAQGIGEIKDKVREKSESVLKTGARPDTRVACTLFPGDIDDTDQLLSFEHSFLRFTGVDKIYTHSADIVKMRAYQIETNMNEILDRAIEQQGLKIHYTPAEGDDTRSVLQSVLELEDASFGVIDAGLLTESVRARGLTLRLGNYVLEQVFSYAGSQRFKESEYDQIRVFVSVVECMQMDFTDHIWELREKYDVHPEQICFCISESVYESMSSVLEENLKKLAALGYGIERSGAEAETE